MAMESVLNQLEERIEELVDAYRGALDRAAKLEGRISELETELGELTSKLDDTSDANDRIAELEQQRNELAGRLEKVLGVIDGALDDAGSSD